MLKNIESGRSTSCNNVLRMKKLTFLCKDYFKSLNVLEIHFLIQSLQCFVKTYNKHLNTEYQSTYRLNFFS